MVVHYLLFVIPFLMWTENSRAEISLGNFNSYSHGVMSGAVSLVDDKTIRINDFSYSGSGPAAWFIVGKGSGKPPSDYIVLPNEEKSCSRLGKYQKKTIKLTLPGSWTWRDVDWLQVYCLQFNVKFGQVNIPENVGSLANGANNNLKACKTRWNS